MKSKKHSSILASRKVIYAHVAVAVVMLAAAVAVINTKPPAHNSSSAAGLLPLNVTTLASGVDYAATFQSHNQKVVSNQYGIFVTYLVTVVRPEQTHGVWRLARSTDGGATFQTVYENGEGTGAPVLDTTSSGSIYVAYINWDNPNHSAQIVRFDPSTNYRIPTAVATLVDAAHGKFAMIVDEARQQLYYVVTTGYGAKFFIVGFDGSIRKNSLLLVPGDHAGLHYPNVYVDEFGDVYLAWTTLRLGYGTSADYYSIHVMRSTNGGQTWVNGQGKDVGSENIVSDDTGPATEISQPDEHNLAPWLSGFLVKNHVGHFMYSSGGEQYGRQHYVRYNFTTGKLEQVISPNWNTETLRVHSFDGFCASDKQKSDAPIYCTGWTWNGRVGVIVSFDGGKTWHDFAQTPEFQGSHTYAIGGNRQITADGKLIGVYTELADSGINQAKFFSVQVSAPLSPPPPQSVVPPPAVSNQNIQQWGTKGDVLVPADYDGDGKADFAIWRPSTSTWWVINSSNKAQWTKQWGTTGDIPVPADYDGDTKTDLAIWRPSTGTWWVIKSSDGKSFTKQWGSPGDIPVLGDYDGDKKADFAIWRPSTKTWWITSSSIGTYRTKAWGSLGDTPVPGDYDGDGKTDVTMWRPSTGVWWIIQSSTDTVVTKQWGYETNGDIPVPRDYDGDKKTDIAVWRAPEGNWYIVKSSDGKTLTQQWGYKSNGDIPAPADFNGDGKTDLVVWRAPEGKWYIK